MLVFAMVAHEYAHAITALRQGDDTAYMLGRVTLNPIPHIDPWMSVLLPAMLWFSTSGAFTFGGARPVPVNPRKFRNYRRGDIIVSSAGVITNLGLAGLFALLFVALGGAAGFLPSWTGTFETGQRMLLWGIWLNLVLCFFNLIPIPPLDGSHLFYHILPPRAGLWYRGLARLGYLPLMALLIFFRPAMNVLMTPAYKGLGFILGLIAPYQAGSSIEAFLT